MDIGRRGVVRWINGAQPQTEDVMARFTIEFPQVVTAKVRGHEVTLDLSKAKDTDTMTEIVRRLAMYGMRKFNDAAPMGLKAPVGDEEAMKRFTQDCAGNAESMIARWLAGDFEAERGEREPSDPVAAKAWEIASRMVREKYGKLAKDATDADKAARKEMIGKAAAHEKVRELAKEELAKAAALADII